MSLEIKLVCIYFDRAALNTEPISDWKDVLWVSLSSFKTILDERITSALQDQVLPISS